jgi:DNA mismatch repair ATPase MutS
MELNILRRGLKLLQTQEFESPLLLKLVNRARVDDAHKRIRTLEKLTKAFFERDREWFYLFSRNLLIGTQVFWAIEKWRSRNGKAMQNWLSTWGEFEALVALANYAHEHPENTFPRFVCAGSVLDAEAMGHPLLPDTKCVRNQIALNDETRFYLIGGSNMAGKSTMLRAIGLNAVLAYAGAPVCAKSMQLSRLQICASLAIQDSLVDGKSKFLAEMDRLRLALTLPLEDGPVLFLIDELLSGTNSNDRRVAGEMILREFIRRGAIGALSTHDLSLTEIATMPDLHGANMHMASPDSSEPLNFDYLLKPGVTRQSNALAIARLAGVPI